MSATARYPIGELATLGGVSRRTVRYYVQEGLISPPLGLGRGNHYTPEHLEQLLRVKALQESGQTLDDIRASLTKTPQPRAAQPLGDDATARSLWRRITLMPGVELHVSSTVRLPTAGHFRELAEWCRTHVGDAVNTHEKEE
jgi:DNA-binding transcriptional MerR regulator